MTPKALLGQLPKTRTGDPAKDIAALHVSLASVLRNLDTVFSDIPWTPVITAETGTFTTTTATGTCTKIGPRYFYDLAIVITTVGTATGAVIFTLPTANGATAHVGSGRETVAAGKSLTVTIDASATTGKIRNYDNSTPAASGATLVVAGNFIGA